MKTFNSEAEQFVQHMQLPLTHDHTGKTVLDVQLATDILERQGVRGAARTYALTVLRMRVANLK